MMKILHKIIIYNFILIVITIVITGFTFKEINSRNLFSKVAEMSEQSNTIIRENVLLTMDTVNNFSKMLLSNELVQKNLPLGYETTQAEARKINLYLLEFLDSAPLFSSIYVFDLQGNRYSSDTQRTQTALSLQQIKDVGLYDKAMALNGSPIVSVNVDHLIQPRFDGNLVSYARVINSTETMEPIGMLIVNINGNDIQPAYERVGEFSPGLVKIYDDHGNVLSTTGEQYVEMEYLIPEYYTTDQSYEGAIVKAHENQNYVVSATKINKYNWKIINVTPFSEAAKENDQFNLILLSLLVVNFLFLLIGSLIISRIITVPIGGLVRAMRKVNTGQLVRAEFKPSSYEMTVLRDGYNAMIERIDDLIARIISEQKKLRKAELSIIQAQIKPHFLYNAFDAISSLSFAGNSQTVYRMVKALGIYYRNSLSNGQEVISLKKELDIVRSYIDIQNIRYRNLIELELHIDLRYVGFPVLKLILQPLVENSLYHGIKPLGHHGKIVIDISKQGKWLVIKVIDNGIGMSPKKLAGVLTEPSEKDASALTDQFGGFGLRSTIERIQLYYELPNLISITSEENKGTEVIIRIPINEQKGEL